MAVAPTLTQRVLAVAAVAIPVAYGVRGLTSPDALAVELQLPGSTAPSDRANLNFLFACMSVRDFFMGAAIAIGVSMGSRNTLGALVTALGGVAIGDGLSVLQSGLDGYVPHLTIGTVISCMGVWIWTSSGTGR